MCNGKIVKSLIYSFGIEKSSKKVQPPNNKNKKTFT